MVLARDRTGIRPLFYTEAAGRLLFASEIKALFALPEVRRSIDPQALAEICTYWSPLAPRTAFEGVSSLPPGHIMVVTDGARRLHRYWDWEFPEPMAWPRRTEADYAEELRALLIDAVRLQLRADVPVGAYLSGGLDSSIITSVIHNFTDTPLRTFSLTFEDAEFDESAFQQELVNFLGTTHTSVRCTRSDIANAFPRTIFHAETPIVRTAPAPLMLLSGHVRASGYKVVLTGEGADEVFGGYDLFKEAKIRRFWARSPAFDDAAAAPGAAIPLPQAFARSWPRLHTGVLQRRHGARRPAILLRISHAGRRRAVSRSSSRRSCARRSATGIRTPRSWQRCRPASTVGCRWGATSMSRRIP